MSKDFKHLIITRFMCDNFIPNNADVQSDLWKEMSFKMAKKHIISTLENQSNLFLMQCNYLIKCI